MEREGCDRSARVHPVAAVQAPGEENGFLANHVSLLLQSLERLTGRELVAADLSPVAAARAVYRAPFVVVSHGLGSDPVFNYGNLTAQRLWEMSWEEFTSLPSRLSAEPQEQGARARFLARVAAQGYVDDYTGVRVSSTRRRFRIERALVWNVTDAGGRLFGQAASFAQWTWIT